MKKIGEILRQKKSSVKKKLDDKSLFYFFNREIEKEFGSKGLENLKPSFWKDGKLFVKSKSSTWASELWINRQDVIEKINKEIGSKEIREIKIKT